MPLTDRGSSSGRGDADNNRPAAHTKHIGDELEARIGQELPHLQSAEQKEIARSVARLVEAFDPEMIYVFGSHARGTPHADSDIDLLVLVATSDEPAHRRARTAYAAVGAHVIPLDILVMTRGEFQARLPAVASLPATVVREGRTLYAPSA